MHSPSSLLILLYFPSIVKGLTPDNGKDPGTALLIILSMMLLLGYCFCKKLREQHDEQLQGPKQRIRQQTKEVRTNSMQRSSRPLNSERIPTAQNEFEAQVEQLRSDYSRLLLCRYPHRTAFRLQNVSRISTTIKLKWITTSISCLTVHSINSVERGSMS